MFLDQSEDDRSIGVVAETTDENGVVSRTYTPVILWNFAIIRLELSLCYSLISLSRSGERDREKEI